jgi:signal peptidase II
VKGRAAAIGMVCGFALLVAAVDQGIKGVVTATFAPNASRVILPGIFSLTYRRNTGAAFSLLHDSPIAALLTLNLLVVGVFLLLIRPYLSSPLGRLAAVLVLGGALGNLIDRLRLHYVIDYLDFHVWPVFNLADACVVIGIGALILSMLRAERGKPRAPEEASA